MPGLAYVLTVLGPVLLRKIEPELPIQLSFVLLLPQQMNDIGHYSELIECNSAVEIFALGDGGILQGVDEPRNRGETQHGQRN
jgi:hypothetical protein